jgi:hypothetical protein
VAMGVLLYTNEFTRVNTWFQDLGINAISEV